MTEADTCRAYIVPKLHAAKTFTVQSRGMTISGISKQQQKKVIVPGPPLEEQRRLVAYLDGLQAQVSRLRALQAASQQELDALMPSILDKAFKGEL
jgi:type I restriction enzyme S subunit